MEDSHVGITIEDIQREQDSIDKLIDTLLTSDSTTLLREPHSDNVKEVTTAKASSPSQAKRGRGRPPKSTSTLNRAFSPVQKSPSRKPSLDDIVKCITKLNSQNRKLLLHVESLTNSVNNQRCNCVENEKNGNLNGTDEEKEVVNEEITNRLEKIEQAINSNVLVCNGPGVPELVNKVKTGSYINLERLKGNLCSAVCGDEITEIDIKNLSLSLFGRDKTSLKIDCANSSSKLHIVKQARLNKPKGIYISEFLAKPKLQIFRNLRNLKKLHPNKIKSVFTKEGNIYYRLHGADRPVLVKSGQEIENIVSNLPTTEVATPYSNINIPISAVVDTHPSTVNALTVPAAETATSAVEGTTTGPIE